MSITDPAVTAVMPVRDDADHVAAAIASVLAQDHPGPVDLVVAVGPSSDDTEHVVSDIARRDPRVRVVANPGGATAAGLNAAVAAATGSVIVRVDAHCVLPAGYVSRACATLARTHASNVGGVQRAIGHSPYQRAVAAAMTSRFGVGDARFHYGGDEGPADTVYLGVFRAAALREVGGFDESLVRNQDYELNIRLRAAGHVVWFDPELVVEYLPRDTPHRLARQYFDYGRWKREVVRRHPRATKARHLVAPVTVGAIAAGIAVAATGRRIGLVAPAVYAGAVVAATVATEVDHRGDRHHLLGVFPTMHLAWGAGFLAGPPVEVAPT